MVKPHAIGKVDATIVADEVRVVVAVGVSRTASVLLAVSTVVGSLISAGYESERKQKDKQKRDNFFHRRYSLPILFKGVNYFESLASSAASSS